MRAFSLSLLQLENDDSYWKIPRLGRYYREVWAEEDGETCVTLPPLHPFDSAHNPPSMAAAVVMDSSSRV